MVIALVLTAGALALPFIPESQAVPRDCGETTLEGTIVRKPDGTLECGPGEGITVREDLAQAGAGRDQRRKPFKAFFTIADLQLADEESPARGEWADACGENPAKGAFRPHEAFVPHLINAHVRAANRIAKGGSPVLQHPFDFAVALGDLVDNQQYNETRWMIDLFDGGKLVNPDSGKPGAFGTGDGYNGVQAQDPAGGSPALEKPANAPTAPGPASVPLINLANEPFWAAGLREPPGSHLRWYTVMGNHDMKIQGTIPDDDPVWRAFIRAAAVGSTKVTGVPQGSQGEACEGFDDPNYWMNVLPTVGNTTAVPADPDRRLLDRQGWIDEHAVTTGIPVGHGLLPESNRCPAQPATLTTPASVLRRACYHWIEEPFHYITLDTTASEGLENGNIDPVQFAWLEERLKSSSTTYFDEQGGETQNPGGKDRLIVIFAHHPHESMVNPGYPWNEAFGPPPNVQGGVKLGQDLIELFLRFPNVILHADGHTHKNKIWPHKDDEKGTAYWEVNTSAIADFPLHSRTIEIADNLDGTISIFAVIFDAAVDPNVRPGSGIDWVADDPTPTEELAAGADRQINEDWLASAGREILFNDPQQDFTKIGTAADRNVELLLGTPFPLPTGGRPSQLAATGGQDNRTARVGAITLVLMALLAAASLRRRKTLLPDR